MTKRHRSAVTGGGIYAIVRKDTGDMYVGSAVKFARRWSAHNTSLRNGYHHSRQLQNVFNKHGPDAFDYVVLERVADESTLVEREQVWIDTLQPNYNSAPVAGSCLGVKLSPRSPEYRAKASAARMGKKRGPHSKAHREALSAAHKGKTLSWDHREKLSKINLGKRRSDEARAAMSVAQKRRRAREKGHEQKAA